MYCGMLTLSTIYIYNIRGKALSLRWARGTPSPYIDGGHFPSRITNAFYLSFFRVASLRGRSRVTTFGNRSKTNRSTYRHHRVHCILGRNTCIYICTWQISKAHVSWEQPIDRRAMARVGGTHLLPFSGSVGLGNLAFSFFPEPRGRIMMEVVGGLLFFPLFVPRALVLVKVQTDGAKYG